MSNLFIFFCNSLLFVYAKSASRQHSIHTEIVRVFSEYISKLLHQEEGASPTQTDKHMWRKASLLY